MDEFRLHCYAQKGRRQEIKIEENIYANNSEEAKKLLINILEKYSLNYSYISVMCLTAGYSDKEKANLNFPINPELANKFYLHEKLRRYSR